MRKEIVPVDLVSEQKTILSLVSIRQLIYVSIGVVLIYQIVTFLYGFIEHMMLVAQAIIYITICSPIVGVIYWLGFWYRDDHDMFWDKYLLIDWNYRKNHTSYIYHHGDDIPKWRK